MKRTKIMALLLAFCLAVPSPMATLAADTSTTPTIEGTTGDSQNPENGGASKDKENGETKDADQDGKQEGNSQSADGKSAEENSGNDNSVNGDSKSDKNGSGESANKNAENKNSENGNAGENGSSQTGENLAKSGNSENKPVQMNGTGYDTIQAAIEAIEENGSGTIIVTGSEELTENITIPEGKTVYLNGVKLKASETDKAAITNNGTLTIQSCEINGDQSFPIENHGTLQLNQTSLSTSSTSSSCIVNAKNSDSSNPPTPICKINSGKIAGGIYAIRNESGRVEINGGAEIAASSDSSYVIYNFAEVIINDGVFKQSGKLGVFRNDPDISPKPTTTILGGTFSSDTQSYVEKFLAKGTTLTEVKKEDGTTEYKVEKLPVVAYISGKDNYTSLQDAVDAAEDGDTITMKAGIDPVIVDKIIEVKNKKITLDLNGVTIQSADNLYGQLIVVYGVDGGNGDLTIKDSTAVTSPKVEENGTISYSSGKLYSRNLSKTDSSIYSVAACVAVGNGGTFTLESGTLDGESTYGVYIPEDNGAFTVKGGYIYGKDGAVVTLGKNTAINIEGGVLRSENVVAGIESDANDSKITLKEGTLIASGNGQSASVGIFQKEKGTITVEGGSIYVQNGYGIEMADGVLQMKGGTIRTSGTIASGENDDTGCYGIWLMENGYYIDSATGTNYFGTDVANDKENTFYAEISGGKIVAPNSVEAIKTAVPEDKNCSEKTIGGIVVKKASSGFAPAFSSQVKSEYCYSGTGLVEEKITQYSPTDDRSNQEGVDSDAPYSVDDTVTLSFYPEQDLMVTGAKGNKLDSDFITNVRNRIPTSEEKVADGKVNIFTGWYEQLSDEEVSLTKANLDEVLTVLPAKSTTYLPGFWEVDKGTATGEAELQGTALPKDTTTAGKTVLETMSKAVKSAAEKLAKAVEKAKADTVLVSITVDANKKTRDEVSADADKIQATLASNETIQGYYDVSLTQTTYTASYTDASADVTVAAENGAGTELKPTQTTVSAALYELDTKIPVTLDMDPEYLQNRQLRVVEVHDGKVLDLEYTFDSANNLMTVQMDKFSTVAVVSATYTTVTFDSMGGSDVGKENVSYGNKVTKPADPTRSGYKFLGWYTEKAYKNAYGFDVSVTDMTPFTLYAKWEAVSTDNQDKDKDKNNSNSNSGSKSNSGSSSGSKSSSSSSSVSSANTGDQAAPALWLFVLVLAGAGVAGTGYYFRKKRQ